MEFSDYIQIGVEVAGIAVFAAGYFNRLAVANHNDRMARITGAAGNLAGVIRSQLNALPAGSNVPAMERLLIAKGIPALAAEFSDSLKAVGGNNDKLARIVAGQLGQIPPAPVASGGDTETAPIDGSDDAPVDPLQAAIAALAEAVSTRIKLRVAPDAAPATFDPPAPTVAPIPVTVVNQPAA